MSTYESNPLNLRRLLDVAHRHKRKVVWCPMAALLVGALIYVFCPRTYRSEARIFLRVGRESVGLDPTATTGQTMALQQSDRKDEVKSAIDVLKSRSIIGQAVDQIGPEVVLGRGDGAGQRRLVSIVTLPLRLVSSVIKSIDPVSAREQAIVAVERHLYVSAERESTLIVVQYDAASPQLAQSVCEAVVEVYRREHMRIYRNEESSPFFAEQQERLRGQLDHAMAAVRDVKNEVGLSSVEQRRTTLEAQYNAVELDRLQTEQELATVQARFADLERQLAQLPERLVASKKSVPNQGADLLRQQLYALQVKAMDLQARFSEQHPWVQSANNQLEEAKRVMAEQSVERTETTDDINPIYHKLSLELKQQQSVVAGYKARQAELGQQKESILAELRSLNDQDIKIDQLSRAVDLARDKFMQYSRNMEEARIDKALQNNSISNVSVVQPATLSEKPISPSKPIVLMATLLLAVAGTVTLVFASEQPVPWAESSNVAENGNGAGMPETTLRQRVHHRAAQT